jgi:adenosylmethionine-8-amino-7-oxononanoate aminotransferase
MNDLAALDHRHVWHPFTQHQEWNAGSPLIIERGDGCWLVDVDGRRYLDGVSSLWCNVHGHRHPAIDAAIRDQLDRVAHSTMLGLTHPPAIRLAVELVRRAPPGLNRVFYSDSGATAAEIALKMAFQYQRQAGDPGRTRFATLAGAYHGDTIGAVSVGAIDIFHEIFRPLLFPSLILPAPVFAGGEEEDACLDRALSLLDAEGGSLAALIVEPLVQGAAGMKMHSPRFVRALAEKARSVGALVIADEVAVGFGRLGTLFAMEQCGFAPDLLCLAKGISGGALPLAATLATDAIYDAFVADPTLGRQFFHGHTYTGNPLACAAGLASLARFEEEATLETVARIEADFSQRVARWRAMPGVAGIRHRGVMAGVDVVRPDGRPFPASARAGHRLCEAMRPREVILRPLGDTLVLNPPLALSAEETRILLDALESVLREELPRLPAAAS